ncbi:unnamed protein product [Closterium sp. Naga37s-1]|nr:unnamed protein product [Closterium sp. Naga37s-1]
MAFHVSASKHPSLMSFPPLFIHRVSIRLYVDIPHALPFSFAFIGPSVSSPFLSTAYFAQLSPQSTPLIIRSNGFHFSVDESAPSGRRFRLSAVPFSKNIVFGASDVCELISMLADAPLPDPETPAGPAPATDARLFRAQHRMRLQDDNRRHLRLQNDSRRHLRLQQRRRVQVRPGLRVRFVHVPLRRQRRRNRRRMRRK